MGRKGGFTINQSTLAGRAAPGVVRFFLGEWDQAETELLQCLETARQTNIFLTLGSTLPLGQLRLEQGDFIGATMHFQEAVGIAQARGQKTWELISCALLVQAASKAGRFEEALAHLRRGQQIMSDIRDWRGLVAEVHLAEGVLATAQQRWEEAEAAFQEAVEINRRYHLPYYEARSLLEWGEMHLSRNDAGDRERGMQLLDQALAIFQRIQAKKMVEKVLTRKEPLQA
jgi:tetratricopeptide (TPR) repeat protein